MCDDLLKDYKQGNTDKYLNNRNAQLSDGLHGYLMLKHYQNILHPELDKNTEDGGPAFCKSNII